jgi:hypothetical protein
LRLRPAGLTVATVCRSMNGSVVGQAPEFDAKRLLGFRIE